jgi:hypothetical protein
MSICLSVKQKHIFCTDRQIKKFKTHVQTKTLADEGKTANTVFCLSVYLLPDKQNHKSQHKRNEWVLQCLVQVSSGKTLGYFLWVEGNNPRPEG